MSIPVLLIVEFASSKPTLRVECNIKQEIGLVPFNTGGEYTELLCKQLVLFLHLIFIFGIIMSDRRPSWPIEKNSNDVTSP